MGSINEQQIGIETFAKGQVPDSAALDAVASSEILAASPNRAYAIVELFSVTGGEVHIARGQTALITKGSSLQLGIPQKFFGSESLEGICDTGAQTAVVLVQDFLQGASATVDLA